MIWLIFIVMTGIAVLSVILPLAYAARIMAGEAYNVDVYKDGIVEIDRDHASFRLDSDEVATLKTEVNRPLLPVSFKRSPKTSVSRVPAALAAIAAATLIPATSFFMYLWLGHAGMPDQPRSVRIASTPGHKDAVSTIAQAETYIRSHPADGKAFEFIAPFYLRAHRVQDAIRALETTLRLQGASSVRLAALGEAKVIAAGGNVTDEARIHFEEALNYDKANVTSLYYLGLAAFQKGHASAAIDIWTRLVSLAPDAVWLNDVRATLNDLRRETRN